MAAKKQKKRKERRSTVEATRKRMDTHSSGFENTVLNIPEGAELFKLKSTKPVRIDILPYEVGSGNKYADEGMLYFERTYYVHRNIGAENGWYVCPKKTAGKRCPICEFIAKHWDDEDFEQDNLKNMTASQRQLFNVVDVKDPDRKVQIWDISHHFFGKLLDAKIRNADEDDAYETFADYDEGMTLKLGIEENHYGGRTSYFVNDIEFKIRKNQYEEDILEKVYNLDEMIKILDYDELKKILLQTDDEDDDSNKKSKKSKTAAKTTSKRKEDEDDDLDDEDEKEDEDDDLDDEDEKEDEDEDDDEDDDDDLDDEDDDEDEDEDEDEEPKKKVTKKKVTKKTAKKVSRKRK